MKILIVGAGVAGLSLMGCLKKRGMENITLVEKVPKFYHLGYLIGLRENNRDCSHLTANTRCFFFVNFIFF